MARYATNVAYRYRVVNSTGCWLWTGQVRTNGYGQAPTGKRKGRAAAHRFVYEFHMGPIPEGLELDHLCSTPLCVNPEHLEPVTHAENVRRGRSGAHNKVKTACPQGHKYDEVNTKWYQGRRYCRACANADGKRRRAAKRAVPSVNMIGAAYTWISAPKAPS